MNISLYDINVNRQKNAILFNCDLLFDFAVFNQFFLTLLILPPLFFCYFAKIFDLFGLQKKSYFFFFFDDSIFFQVVESFKKMGDIFN